MSQIIDTFRHRWAACHQIQQVATIENHVTMSYSDREQALDNVIGCGGCLITVAITLACLWVFGSDSKIFSGRIEGTPTVIITAIPTYQPLTQDDGKSFFLNPWVLTVVGGVIVGIIVLYVEYNYFQPRRRQIHEQPVLPQSRTWDNATENALRNFKRKLNKFVWVYEKANVTNISVSKGQATLDVIITTTRHSINDPKPIERYLLKIDRTGDILEMTPISLPEQKESK